MEKCELIEKVFKLIDTTESKYAKALGRVFALQSLTAPQVNVLLLLDKNGAQKISDIAGKLNMMESNVSSICTRLENAGFTYRNRLQNDRRVVKIELTEEAKLKMKDIRAAANALSDKMNALISNEDWEDIYIGLSKMNTMLDLYLENTKE